MLNALRSAPLVGRLARRARWLLAGPPEPGELTGRLSVRTAPPVMEVGVPAGAIRSIDEVYEWDQTRSQGLVVDVEHPALGRIELPGPPLRFEGAEPAEHTAPPELGQHTRDVLAWLDKIES